jgi:hypothetical protein
LDDLINVTAGNSTGVFSSTKSKDVRKIRKIKIILFEFKKRKEE